MRLLSIGCIVAALVGLPRESGARGKGETGKFHGWSRSGWLAKWSYDTTKDGGPGNAMTMVEDLRRKRSIGISDAQLGGATTAAARFAGIRFDGKGRQPRGWRVRVAWTGGQLVFSLRHGRRQILLGRSDHDGKRPRLVATHWAPGGVAVAFMLATGNDSPFAFFVVPAAVRPWKHRLARVPACREYRRRNRCLQRALPLRRRGLVLSLRRLLARLRRASPGVQKSRCLALDAALRKRYQRTADARSCFP